MTDDAEIVERVRQLEAQVAELMAWRMEIDPAPKAERPYAGYPRVADYVPPKDAA